MDFLLSDELIEFKAVLRKFFTQRYPASALKEYICDHTNSEQGTSFIDLEGWQKVAELGALAAAVSEENGGLGFGLPAAQLVVEEAARVLAPIPVFETICFGALPLSMCLQEEQSSVILQAIAEGRSIVSGPLLNLSSGCGLASFTSHADFLVYPQFSDSKAIESISLYALESQPENALLFEEVPTFDILSALC